MFVSFHFLQLLFFFFSFFFLKKLLQNFIHILWHGRGKNTDGRMLDKGGVKVEGEGAVPLLPEMFACNKPKWWWSPEGRVSLPESLWHLLQVLVSVGVQITQFVNGAEEWESASTPNTKQYDGWVRAQGATRRPLGSRWVKGRHRNNNFDGAATSICFFNVWR